MQLACARALERVAHCMHAALQASNHRDWQLSQAQGRPLLCVPRQRAPTHVNTEPWDVPASQQQKYDSSTIRGEVGEGAEGSGRPSRPPRAGRRGPGCRARPCGAGWPGRRAARAGPRGSGGCAPRTKRRPRCRRCLPEGWAAARRRCSRRRRAARRPEPQAPARQRRGGPGAWRGRRAAGRPRRRRQPRRPAGARRRRRRGCWQGLLPRQQPRPARALCPPALSAGLCWGAGVGRHPSSGSLSPSRLGWSTRADSPAGWDCSCADHQHVQSGDGVHRPHQSVLTELIEHSAVSACFV